MTDKWQREMVKDEKKLLRPIKGSCRQSKSWKDIAYKSGRAYISNGVGILEAFPEFENLARVVISGHTKIVKPQLKWPVT